MSVLSEVPRVVLYNKFLSDQEVLHLLNLGEGKYKPSTVTDITTGGDVANEARTGKRACLMVGQDTIVKNIEERLANVTGTRTAQGEDIQLVQYGPGEEYKPHFDWFDPKYEGFAKQLERGGQRVASCIMYLKAPTQGGETNFPDLNIKVTPQVGDMLYFENVDAKGQPEPKSLHGGSPVLEGEKVIATRWIRERAFDGSEEPKALTEKAKADAKLADAKKAAQTAQVEYQKAMQEEKAAREKLCFEAVNKVLREYKCQMYGVPDPQIGENGALMIGGRVELEAMPLESQKR